MALVQVGPQGAGPDARTRALVIGVSNYPYVDGPDATARGRQSRLVSLSVAAQSAAEVAAWILEEYHNLRAPLQDLRILLSPSSGEAIPPAVQSQLSGPCPATVAEVERELKAFYQSARDRPQDVLLVYVAGHGVQLTKRGAVVLLEDYAAPAHAKELEGSLDFAATHAAFNGSGFPNQQLWISDACRQPPEVQEQFDRLNAPRLFDEPLGDVESSPLILGSLSRGVAWAQRGVGTLLSQGLLSCLRADAITGPDPDVSSNWHVSVMNLCKRLPKVVMRLANAHDSEQPVDVTGRVNDGLIHELSAPPDVPIGLKLDPPGANGNASATLWFNGTSAVFSNQSAWPINDVVKAGLYTLTVEANAPFQPIPHLPLNVLPPKVLCTVEVRGTP